MKLALSVLFVGSLALTAGCNFGNSSKAGDGGPGFDGGNGAVLSAGGGSASGGSQDFGNVQVGHQSAPASITVTNSGSSASGPLSVTLTGGDAASFGIDTDACTGQALTAGSTCTVAVHFLPTTAGAQSASLSIDASPGGLASVALSGTGTEAGGLSITPATQAFGTVSTGSSSPATTFTVTSTAALGSALAMSLTGSNAADFTLGADGCTGKTLTAGGTCTVGVTFSPTTSGSLTATLQAASGSLAATSSLAGTASSAAAFSVTPGTYDFGSLSEGLTSAAQSFTVKNTGGVASGAPTVALSGANQGDFAVASSTCGSALAAGATCTFGVTFKPSTTAAESASVAVTAAGTTSANATLSGTGLAPAPIAFSPTTQPFGTEVPGQASADFPFTLTNSAAIATGNLTVTLTGTDATQFAVSADTCTGKSLAAAGTCAVSVHFKPDGTVPSGPVSATLQATGTPGGTTASTLTGTITSPTQITVSPTSQGFGTVVQLQASSDFPFVVTNSGGVTSGTLTVALGGTNAAEFALGTNGCTGTLAGGASCTVNVHFAPAAGITGVQNATLTAGDTAADTATATLTATAVAPASLTVTPPTGFTGFGPTANPTVTADVPFTVKNGGGVATGSLTVALGGANAGQFALGADTCSNTTLAANGATTCTVNVHFAPTAGTVGNEQATLTVSGTPGGSAPVSFVGIAAKPATFVITPPTGFTSFPTTSLTKSSAPVTFTVENTGGVSSGAPITVTSANADFAVTAGTCGATALAASGTCTFDLTFTPTTTGTPETSVVTASAPTTASGTYTATGTGGIPTLGITPPTGFTTFGPVAVGQSPSPTATFTLKNTGPVATLAAPTLTSSGADYTVPAATNGCTAVLAASGSCTFVVVFAPSTVNANDATTLTASVTPGTAGTYTITSTGAEATLSVSPPTGWTGFGTIEEGTSAPPVTFTVTNTGAVATIVAPTLHSSSTDFVITPGACNTAVAANGGTCTFVLTFTPHSVTAESSTLTVTATDATTGTYVADGTGAVPTLTISPPSTGFSFGDVTIGQTSAPATFKVTNTGPVASAAPSVTSSNADFAAVASCGALAVNATCSFTVTFKPSTTAGETTVLTASVAPDNAGTYTVGGTGATGALEKLSPWAAGTVVQGQTATTTFTVTNGGLGATDPLTITGPTGTGFSKANDNCTGKNVAPSGGTCTFQIVFAPTSANSTPGTQLGGTVTVADPSSAGDTQTGSFTGMPISASYYLVFTSPTGGSFGTFSSGNPVVNYTITNWGAVEAPAFDDTPIQFASATPASVPGFINEANVSCPVGSSSAAPGIASLGSCAFTLTFQTAQLPAPLGSFTATIEPIQYNRAVLPFTAPISGDNN